MARIRTIKPEFWSDEKLGEASDVVRLTFLALISMADDYGRVVDNPKQVEAFAFPWHDRSRDIRDSLATLSRMGRIRRGTSTSGQAIIELVHWDRHQRVDKPNKAAALPAIATTDASETRATTDDAEIRECVANDSRMSREPVSNESRRISTTTSTTIYTTTNDLLRPGSAHAERPSVTHEFEAAWRAYPRRPNNSRAKALRAYLARRKAGVTADELLAGVQAYAGFVEQQRIEPRFIKQAATFFGPDRHWAEEYHAPPPLSPGERVLAMAAELAEDAA